MISKIKYFLHLFRNTKPYSVIDCHDDKGNYEFSVICIHSLLSPKNNYIRIKYDKRKCEVSGKISGQMQRQILKEYKI